MNAESLLGIGGWFAAGAVLGWLLTAIGLYIPQGKPVVTKIRRYIYPIMMAITGGCFILLRITQVRDSELVAGIFLVSILIMLTASDLKYRLLPDKIVIPAIAVFALWRVFFHPLPVWNYMLGFLVGGGILYTASYFAVKMNRPPMGGGDIKLMALMGLALGVELSVFTLLLSSFIGMLFGLAMIVTRRMNRGEYLPFGPFIAMAGIAAWLYGEPALQWYYGFFTY